MESDSKQQRILGILQEIQTEIEKHPQAIPDHMFHLLEGICALVYRWREGMGVDGWSKKVIDLPMEQQKILEGGFQTLDGFFYKEQLGGGWAPQSAGAEDKEYIHQASLNDGYYGLIDHIKKVGTQWSQVQQALGVVNPETDTPIDGVLGFVGLLIEGIRIWIALNPIDSESYRFFFSVSQALLDAVRGNTKQALLSSLGIIDQRGLMLSVLGRFMLTLAAMRSNKLKAELSLDIYKTTKTALSAFLLWAFSLLAPDATKAAIRDSLAQIEDLAKEDNINISSIKKKFETAATKAGLRSDMIPGMADLQQLQDIFQKKEITCSPRFKELLKPISEVFSLRLAFDLAGIPTTDSEIATICEAKLKGGIRRVRKTRRFRQYASKKTRRM